MKRSRFSPDQRELTDKEKSLKDKADKLVEWLEKQAPREPLRINAGVSVANFTKAVKTHKKALKNTKVGSPAWLAYASNLAAIKIAIQKQLKTKEE